ncbi:MAG: adenylate/guanylate cyclase domain-containing protein [Pseudomonadota bacterium]
MASDITAWLTELGLEKYADAFIEAEVDLDVLPELEESDLRELGLPLGPRKKILRAAKEVGANEPAPAADAAAAASNQGERRELTVMFIDLVGSTSLARRLDPEDLRDMVRAYQTLCGRSVSRFDGFVARFFGDGIMVYFGYPQAHENDAERSVRAALDIMRRLDELNADLASRQLEAVDIRIGIATGLVVAGDLIGEGASEERAVVGETPNLAARLQGLAEPNQIVVAPETIALVEGLFHFESLGPQELKGFGNAVVPYRVEGETGARSAFDANARRGLSRLIGRETELRQLTEAWERARDRRGQVVHISGEAGIGKSRLVFALREQVETQTYLRIRYQCSPFHQNAALFPVVDEFARMIGFEPSDDMPMRQDKVHRYFAAAPAELRTLLPEFAQWLNVAWEPVAVSDPGQARERMMAFVDGYLGFLAERRPVLLHIDDAQYADPTTLELVERLLDSAARRRVLVVITSRPEFVAPWPAMSHFSTLILNRLSVADTESFVRSLTEELAVPDWLREQIVERTDGIPLFVEELTKAVTSSKASADEMTSGALMVPSTVRDSLLARLDQLSPSREVAQVAAVIGREFSFSLLAHVSDFGSGDLRGALDQLEDAQLLFRRGEGDASTYRFKHSLLSETVYSTLLRPQRTLLHRRVAEALSNPNIAGARADASLIAHHYTEAGSHESAIAAWVEAASQSLAQSATEEAEAAIERGIGLLEHVESNDPLELELQSLRGWVLIATRGYSAPETRSAFERALALSRSLDEQRPLFGILHGVWACALLAAEVNEAYEVAEELLTVARREQNPVNVIAANRVFGTTAFWRGEFIAARTHLSDVLASFDAHTHTQQGAVRMFDTRVVGLDFLSLAKLAVGEVDEAYVLRAESDRQARELDQAVTLAIILQHSCLFHLLARNVEQVRHDAEALLALSEDVNLPFWIAHSRFFLAWTQSVEEGDPAALDEMARSVQMIRDTNSDLFVPYYTALRFEQASQISPHPEHANGIESCITAMRLSGERWCEVELLRLLGRCRAAVGAEGAGEPLRAAWDVARDSGAWMFALRAANAAYDLAMTDEAKRLAALDVREALERMVVVSGALADVDEARAHLATM